MKSRTHRYLLQAAAVLTAAAAFSSCHSLGPKILEDVDVARNKIAPNLLQLGAKNWVVIAEPAYPLPAGASVVCVNVPTSTIDTFREVLDLLERQGACVPRIWVSHELSAVPENRAPGISAHRNTLENLLLSRFHYAVNSRVIDMQLAQAAKDYRLLFIRTNTRLPYSSIAIELDTGYWNSDAEAEVQKRVEQMFPSATPAATPATESTPVITTDGIDMPGLLSV